MQWAVDYLLKNFTQAVGYYDRGDPGIWDWQLVDLIADNAWHDLDLSAIVPAGATIVRFQTIFRSTSTNSRFMIREKGNVNSFNVSSIGIQLGNETLEEQLFCAPDADRVIQYRFVSPVPSFFRMTVCGWWMGGNALNTFVNRGDPVAVDFTGVDFTANGAWHDLSLTTIIPSTTRSILCTVDVNYDAVGRVAQFRTKGNVNRPNVSIIRSVFVNSPISADITIPTEGQQIIQYKMEATDYLNVNLTVKGWSF